jgi:hypothetical protein
VLLLGAIPTVSTLIGGAIIIGATLLPGIAAVVGPPANNTDMSKHKP